MAPVDCGTPSAGPPTLRAREAHAGAILDAALDAVITVDHLGRVLEFNRAAEATFGYVREDVLGRELAELIVPPALREAHRRGLACWAEGEPQPGAGGLLGSRIEVDAMRAGGEIFPAELAISRVDVPGPPIFTACIRDVSERKQADELRRAAEFRYRTLVEQLPFVVYVDPPDDAGSRYLSPQIVELLGHTAEEWLAQPGLYERSIHPDDRAAVLEAKRRADETGQALRLEYRMRTADGREVWVEDQSVLVHPPDGGPAFWQGFAVDVTERVTADAERAHLLGSELAQRDFMSAILDTVSIVIVVDRDGHIVSFNRAAEELTGYTFEEVEGRRGDMFLAPEDRLSVASRIAEVTPEVGPTGENFWHAKDGKRHLLSWTNRAILDADGEVAYVVSSAIDITHRARAERAIAEQNERLQQLAFHDPLTGLANRALFTDLVQRIGPDAAADAAILFLDLDDFKRVNDTLGHPVGDKLLCEIGARVQGVLPVEHTVARLGGDEFAILVEDAEEWSPAAVAERVLGAFQTPFHVAGFELFVTASIGIAFGRDADELLRSADVALYRAKAAGKAQYVVYAPTMDDALLSGLELIADLRRARIDEEFVVHYQPVVNLRTGALDGVEALVRWHHPTRGLVAPGEFIPAAEETGLIVEIGRWVLEQACRQVAAWQRDLSCAPLALNVNVSARQLQSIGFVADVRRALAESGLDAGSLTLELTESTLAEARDDTASALESLRELGVGVALDDFGTGYSSLSLLQHVPVDSLKIDRSFVDRLDDRGEDGALVRAILEIGKALGVSVVAEGIETPAQAETLRRLGCRLGQGFHFARPLDAARLAELVEASERSSAA